MRRVIHDLWLYEMKCSGQTLHHNSILFIYLCVCWFSSDAVLSDSTRCLTATPYEAFVLLREVNCVILCMFDLPNNKGRYSPFSSVVVNCIF